MKMNSPLSQDKKLTVVFRVEAGCLGPKGEDHIDEFCRIATNDFKSIDSDFIHWKITPRDNKSLSEMEYRINNKNLSHDKAATYLDLFKKNLDEFEEHLHDKLAVLIDQYLGY